jgi:hypothetical protein
MWYFKSLKAGEVGLTRPESQCRFVGCKRMQACSHSDLYAAYFPAFCAARMNPGGSWRLKYISKAMQGYARLCKATRCYKYHKGNVFCGEFM